MRWSKNGWSATEWEAHRRKALCCMWSTCGRQLRTLGSLNRLATAMSALAHSCTRWHPAARPHNAPRAAPARLPNDREADPWLPPLSSLALTTGPLGSHCACRRLHCECYQISHAGRAPTGAADSCCEARAVTRGSRVRSPAHRSELQLSRLPPQEPRPAAGLAGARLHARSPAVTDCTC